MPSVTTNFDAAARRMRRRASRMERAARRGLASVLRAVERKQVENLSGGDDAAAGSYPVPNRSGHLRRSAGRAQKGLTGEVVNTAGYAPAIHEGWSDPDRNIPAQAGRTFLQDAADATDVIAIMSRPIGRALR